MSFQARKARVAQLAMCASGNLLRMNLQSFLGARGVQQLGFAQGLEVGLHEATIVEASVRWQPASFGLE